jgi:hypothetical protein
LYLDERAGHTGVLKMNEVRGLLETALAAKIVEVLTGADLSCAVVKGDSEGNRPDQYVAVVAGTAEARGVGHYLVQTEIRVVGPVDDAVVAAKARQRLRAICDYLDDPACSFRRLQTEDLLVSGFYLSGMDAQKGSRSRAEIVRLKIGAAAVMPES